MKPIYFNNRILLTMFTKISTLLGLACSTLLAAEKPNIVFLFCDDFGYGDIQALNPERSKILTPELNKLAAEGMIFTDAHTSSSVCTPSRYGLMTGRYNWRTKLQSGVVQGHAPNLIAADRTPSPPSSSPKATTPASSENGTSTSATLTQKLAKM